MSKNRGRAKVKDNPTLEKDMSTNGVINNNRSDYIRRLEVKKHFRAKDNEIQSLKSEVQELKSLLRSVIDRIDRPKTTQT